MTHFDQVHDSLILSAKSNRILFNACVIFFSVFFFFQPNICFSANTTFSNINASMAIFPLFFSALFSRTSVIFNDSQCSGSGEDWLPQINLSCRVGMV